MSSALTLSRVGSNRGRSTTGYPNGTNGVPNSAGPPPRPSKRLILCEDGTWLNSDSNSLRSGLNEPSNVTRISRAIRSVSRDGIPQVVYYHFGVGAGGSVVDRIYGGLSGEGLAEITREGYQFLSANYVPNDEIFLFGFSRGAFTARSIGGLIDVVGILTKDGLPFLAEIFRDVQNRHNEHYHPKNPDLPFPNKPSANDPEYARGLQRRGLTRLHVPIKVVGVWETVGALGTPKVGWLKRLGLQSSTQKELSFYDTSLGNCIENAFQALALDERRFAFQPTLWEKMEGNTSTLRQVWFPGVHSNVGGGLADQQIANITLAWMVSQCSPYLDFDEDYVLDEWERTDEYYEKQGEKIRPWSFGEIINSMTGFYALGGAKTRTPGRYTAYDPETGEATRDPLQDTHEYVHPSVRARTKLGGPGTNDHGRYDSRALKDWKLNIEYPNGAARKPNIFWKARFKDRDVSTRIMPEAPLWGLEKELLEYDPETEEYVMKPSAVRQRRSKSAKPSRRSSPG